MGDGEPNNNAGGGQDCGQLYSNAIDDVSCDEVKPYVCEFEAESFAFTTCQLACLEYQYFAVQDIASPYGGQCFCGKSLADATQYGPSNGCPGQYLSYANDVYENLLFTNLKGSDSWRLIAAKQITTVADEAANVGDIAKDVDTVVVVKVPQFGFELFVFAVVAISAVMCVGWWCTRKKTVYAKVSYVSEAETEENGAINDE